MSIERAITIIAGIFGILGVLDSAIQRYNKATTAKYAAQRDFEHLRRNQEQFKESLKLIIDENDNAKEEVIKLRTQMDTLIAIQKER